VQLPPGAGAAQFIDLPEDTINDYSGEVTQDAWDRKEPLVSVVMQNVCTIKVREPTPLSLARGEAAPESKPARGVCADAQWGEWDSFGSDPVLPPP
jgi:hypothetical protein